jgi:hypothetical protein
MGKTPAPEVDIAIEAALLNDGQSGGEGRPCACSKELDRPSPRDPDDGGPRSGGRAHSADRDGKAQAPPPSGRGEDGGGEQEPCFVCLEDVPDAVRRGPAGMGRVVRGVVRGSRGGGERGSEGVQRDKEGEIER